MHCFVAHSRLLVAVGATLVVWEGCDYAYAIPRCEASPVAQIETGGEIFSLALLANGTVVLGGDGRLSAVDWQDSAAPVRALTHAGEL